MTPVSPSTAVTFGFVGILAVLCSQFFPRLPRGITRDAHNSVAERFTNKEK